MFSAEHEVESVNDPRSSQQDIVEQQDEHQQQWEEAHTFKEDGEELTEAQAALRIIKEDGDVFNQEPQDDLKAPYRDAHASTGNTNHSLADSHHDLDYSPQGNSSFNQKEQEQQLHHESVSMPDVTTTTGRWTRRQAAVAAAAQATATAPVPAPKTDEQIAKVALLALQSEDANEEDSTNIHQIVDEAVALHDKPTHSDNNPVLVPGSVAESLLALCSDSNNPPELAAAAAVAQAASIPSQLPPSLLFPGTASLATAAEEDPMDFVASLHQAMPSTSRKRPSLSPSEEADTTDLHTHLDVHVHPDALDPAFLTQHHHHPLQQQQQQEQQPVPLPLPPVTRRATNNNSRAKKRAKRAPAKLQDASSITSSNVDDIAHSAYPDMSHATGRQVAPITGSTSSPNAAATGAAKKAKAASTNAVGHPHQRFTPDQQARWDEMYQRLLDYKEQHGNTKVPESYEDTKLANWVGNQRRAMSRMRRGVVSYGLDPRRIELLEQIGFEWAQTRGSATPGAYERCSWEDMFQRLVRFKDANGHTKIPNNFRDKRLVTWVANQRKAMSRKQRGLPFRCINEEKVQMLDSIGFIWSVPHGARHTVTTSTTTATTGGDDDDVEDDDDADQDHRGSKNQNHGLSASLNARTGSAGGRESNAAKTNAGRGRGKAKRIPQKQTAPTTAAVQMPDDGSTHEFSSSKCMRFACTREGDKWVLT